MGTVSHMGWKYRLTTLGCKVSQDESQQIHDLGSRLVVGRAGPEETSDSAAINTPAVTARASSRSRRAIGPTARGGSTSVIVVRCGATADAEQLAQIDCVPAVIGPDTDVGTELPRLEAHRIQSAPANPLDDVMKVAEHAAKRPCANRNDVWMIPVASRKRRGRMAPRTAFLPFRIITPRLPVVKADREWSQEIRGLAEHQRAFLTAQNGGGGSCTFYIIRCLC